MDEAALGQVITRLRGALSLLSPQELESAFRSADTDGSGAIGPAELKKCLQSLGFSVNRQELDDIFSFFDSDGEGTISLQEFTSFADKDAAADVGGEIGALVNRVRGVLMGVNEEELKKAWSGGSAELDASQLLAALNKLGVISLSLSDVQRLLGRIDADGNGRVSYSELSGFLNQKKFAAAVRKIMKKCAALLRARGSSLQRQLEKAAAGAGGNAGSVTAATLSRVLVQRLRFPLSDAQLAAIIAMADIDGNGDCDIEEILYLADEDYEEVRAGAANRRDSNVSDVSDAGSDSGAGGGAGGGSSSGTASALRGSSTSIGARGKLDALQAMQDSANFEVVGAGDMAELAGERRGQGEGEGEAMAWDDYFTPPSAAPARLYASPYARVPGSAPFDGVPLSRLVPVPAAAGRGKAGVKPPLTAWHSIVNSVYAALAVTAAGTAAAGSLTAATAAGSGVDPQRMPTALAALGLALPPHLVTAILRRVDPTGAGTGRLDQAGFYKALDVALMVQSGVMKANGPLLEHGATVAGSGGGGLHPVAALRVAAALRTHAAATSHGANKDAYLSRAGLASALLHVVGAGLSPAQAVAVAAHAPGHHQSACLAAVHGAVDAALDDADADADAEDAARPDRSRSERDRARVGAGGGAEERKSGEGGREAGEAAAKAAADSDTSFLQRAKGGAGRPAYPASISILSRAAPLVDADVSVSRFMGWLHTVAAGGACLPLLGAPGAAAAIEVFCGPFAAVYRDMDAVARSAARQLCGGAITLPAPLHPASLRSVSSSSASAATAADDGGGSETLTLATAYLLLATRLPASFRPPRLGLCAAAWSHSAIAGGLLECGLEADPASLALTASGPGPGPGGGAKDAHATLLAAASAGLGADGFGLSLRYASVLPGALEAHAGCLPLAPVPDKSTLLRPMGAAATQADASWATEGEVVRATGKDILTVITQLQGVTGVPLPADDALRALIRGRLLRVAVVDATVPAEEHTPPRLRLLSNAVVCPATWTPTEEDKWVFAQPSAAATSKLVVRSDQPRDKSQGQGPAAAMLVFELCIVLTHPQSASGAAAASTTASVAASSSSASGGGGALVGAGYADPVTATYSTATAPAEEICCAWGSVTMAELAAATSNTTHKLRLTGGSVGAGVAIAESDILRRRTGFAAAAKAAVAGGGDGTVLTFQVQPLSKLNKAERQSVGRLPLTCVLPYAYVPTLESLRKVVAERLLSASRSHLPAPDYLPATVSTPLAAAAALLPLTAPTGNTVLLPLLSKTLAAEVAAKKKAGSKDTPEAVLQAVLQRLTPIVAAEAGSAALNSGYSEVLEPTISTALASQPLLTLLSAPVQKPVDTACGLV